MLERRGLLLDPFQAEPLARLATDLPGQTSVVNHCGTPVDRDTEGPMRWRAGLQTMARQPNIVIKVSNFASYGGDPSPASMKQVVMTCIDAFGPSRTLFGTDYPVSRRRLSFHDVCAAYRGYTDSSV